MNNNRINNCFRKGIIDPSKSFLDINKNSIKNKKNMYAFVQRILLPESVLCKWFYNPTIFKFAEKPSDHIPVD